MSRIFLLLALLTPTLASDLFHYRDALGTLHVVDSADAIPAQFRDQTKSFTHDPNLHYYGDNSCLGKRFCVSIYVAPWCPACKQREPELRGYLKNLGKDANAGLQVIVGDERHIGNNEELAKSFGYGGVADDDRHWGKLLHVKSYPSVFVQDESGKVIMSGPEAWVYVTAHFSSGTASPKPAFIK